MDRTRTDDKYLRSNPSQPYQTLFNPIRSFLHSRRVTRVLSGGGNGLAVLTLLFFFFFLFSILFFLFILFLFFFLFLSYSILILILYYNPAGRFGRFETYYILILIQFSNLFLRQAFHSSLTCRPFLQSLLILFLSKLCLPTKRHA